MMTERFLPEGKRLETENNMNLTGSPEGLRRAMLLDEILEARVIRCDINKNLIVDLGDIKGIIPRDETTLGADTGQVKDIAIISQVGKDVCFKVMETGQDMALLSRRAAQEEALETFMTVLRNGDIIDVRITHLEPFGAFVDIGCGIISLVGIENISVSRISHPSDRFVVGQDALAVVSGVDREQKRITLSHRELLGTWEENAEFFDIGETVPGIVRGIEEYGSFVELMPNLSGLTERRDGMSEGDEVSVYIKSISPERMKIKLLVIENFGRRKPPATKLNYFITRGRISSWRYSPQICGKKVIESIFE